MESIDVVIPTRNRPEKLNKCLISLKNARSQISFNVHVCDSSNTIELRKKVEEVCKKFEFVKLHVHNGKNVAAARNFCASVSNANLLVNVDDDVYVEEDAIRNLYETYNNSTGWRVVGGSVAWGEEWSVPVVMRLIGYGRRAQMEENPSFIIGAFFMYPRLLATTLPWNERIRTSDDRFMGALWRSKKVKLLFNPDARAFHDDEHTSYDVVHQESHIYANLFDAFVANFNLLRTISYELLGFAAGAKLYFRNPKTIYPYVKYWIKGNIAFIKDYYYLKKLVKKTLPLK